MRVSSLLVCAGAAASGVVLGRLSQPSAAVLPPSPTAAAATGPAPAANPESTALPGSKPVENLATTAGALAFLAKLEKSSASEVCQEMRRGSWQDTLRLDLIKARFLRFPPAERLRALLEPAPDGAPRQIGGWNELYFKTAAEMILTDPDGVARLLGDQAIRQYDGLGPVLEPLLARDGWQAALEFTGKLPPRARTEAKPQLAALLAARDLPAAQTECLKIPEGKDRNLLVSAVADVMADNDPQAALEWAERHFKSMEHSMGHRPDNVTARILQKLMARDPAQAAALLAEHQSAFSNNYGGTEVGELFAGWAARDFKGAEAWLKANPLGDDLQQAALRSIYTQQLNTLEEPGAALGFYQNLPTDLQAGCAGTLLRNVGVKGLPGGLDQFYQTLPQRGRSQFESELRMQMPNLNTEERKQALSLISRSADSQTGYAYMLDSALELIPEAERDGLLSSLSGPVRDELRAKQARTALQSGDLEKAQSLLKGLSGEIKDVLPHSEIAVGLAATDPAAGTAWVESLPDGKTRSSAAINLAANWAKADSGAAAAWARNLPPESGRDAALQEIIEIQGLSGGVRPALELAATIRGESARLSAIASATRSTWFQDQTAARQLLDSQNLTPEQTRTVIDHIETGNKR